MTLLQKSFPHPYDNLVLCGEDYFTGTLLKTKVACYKTEIEVELDEQFNHVAKWAGPYAHSNPGSTAINVQIKNGVIHENYLEPLVNKKISLKVNYVYCKQDLWLQLVSIEELGDDSQNRFSFHAADTRLEGKLIAINKQNDLIIETDETTYNRFSRWHNIQKKTENKYYISVYTGPNPGPLDIFYDLHIGKNISIFARPHQLIDKNGVSVKCLRFFPMFEYLTRRT